MMRKDILITGATGFAGRRLVQTISRYYDKRRILCLVRDFESDFEAKGLEVVKREKLDYVKVDLTKVKTLKNVPANPKLIFHLAANTETLEHDHSVNDLGTKNLLKAIKPTHKTHFLHASTVTFLATRPDCTNPITEESNVYPTNEYSRTKLKAEKYLTIMSKKIGFRLTVLNINTIYGKGVRPNSLFDITNRMALSKNFLSKINWPGVTSIIHVDDVAKTFLEISRSQKINNKNIEKYLLYTENLTLADLYKYAYIRHKIAYIPVNLPNIFWKFCSWNRRLIPYLEDLLPQEMYNWIWRAGLIVDNAAYCESAKLSKRVKKWTPKLLQDNLDSVFPTLPKKNY